MKVHWKERSLESWETISDLCVDCWDMDNAMLFLFLCLSWILGILLSFSQTHRAGVITRFWPSPLTKRAPPQVCSRKSHWSKNSATTGGPMNAHCLWLRLLADHPKNPMSFQICEQMISTNRVPPWKPHLVFTGNTFEILRISLYTLSRLLNIEQSWVQYISSLGSVVPPSLWPKTRLLDVGGNWGSHLNWLSVVLWLFYVVSFQLFCYGKPIWAGLEFRKKRTSFYLVRFWESIEI